MNYNLREEGLKQNTFVLNQFIKINAKLHF